MEGDPKVSFSVTPAERTLLVELLENELRSLPSEIHHTSREYRDGMHEREERVKGLLDHLKLGDSWAGRLG